MRARFWQFAALTMAVVVVYPLSHAPYVAWRYDSPAVTSIGVFGAHYDFDAPYFSETHLPLFSPVEQLIDRTALRRPLFVWSRLWGVEDKLYFDSMMRHFQASE